MTRALVEPIKNNQDADDGGGEAGARPVGGSDHHFDGRGPLHPD